MNWQHCAHMTFFPSHSFEQYYQATRRCWRFGQKNPVKVDIVTTEGEAGVTANLQRKAENADKMFAQLVATMSDAKKLEKSENYDNRMELPKCF
jgi:SNF2 family DNA or RNA helicase